MVGCRVKANCPLVGLGPVGGAPSVGVFLRDSSPYLREFRRKPLKTSNDYVDNRDWGLILPPLVYQLWPQNCSATGRPKSREKKSNRMWISSDNLLIRWYPFKKDLLQKGTKFHKKIIKRKCLFHFWKSEKFVVMTYVTVLLHLFSTIIEHEKWKIFWIIPSCHKLEGWE